MEWRKHGAMYATITSFQMTMQMHALILDAQLIRLRIKMVLACHALSHDLCEAHCVGWLEPHHLAFVYGMSFGG